MGYVEPLGVHATQYATHVLYDSFAGNKRPICFIVSHRIDLNMWNHARVTLQGNKTMPSNWTLPLVDVKSIVKNSDN